jgi:hypothetical protein
VHRTVATLGPYRWRLTGLALGAVAYAGLFVVALAGSRALADVLIALPVLVFLVAGGNYLQHWLGIRRPSPRFAPPPRRPDSSEGDAGDPP